MDILNPDVSYQDFFSRLAASSKSLLMLDYDGTLAPFTTDRDKARPFDQVVPLLKPIVEFKRTRVVIVSGRSVDVLRKLIGDQLNCELWGSHGAERYFDQEVTIALDDLENLQERLATIDRWAERHELKKYLEEKPVGRAFHWRGESDRVAENIAETVEKLWSAKDEIYGLSMHRFDGGIEIRPADITKANTVKALLSEAETNQPIAYLGDDLTDEDAFVALGKRGLKVLVRAQLRDTAADIRLTPPAELIVFLEDWRRATTS